MAVFRKYCCLQYLIVHTQINIINFLQIYVTSPFKRHGTQFSSKDFLRFERVTRDIMDDDMTEMVRNNPADVVYNAFSQAFFQGMVKMFQQDNEMRNIVMTDREAREQATRHFFKRAQRQTKG